MKREFLFSGQRADNGEWVYGYYYHQIVRDSFNSENPILFEKDFIRPIEPIGIFESYEVIPETIGQFTGLTDKNGVKIFEGDIVNVFDKYYNGFATGCAEVFFSYKYAGGWVFGSQSNNAVLGIHTDIVEVIGNIHDNPELLK